jgi:hypothetical protein
VKITRFVVVSAASKSAQDLGIRISLAVPRMVKRRGKLRIARIVRLPAVRVDAHGALLASDGLDANSVIARPDN